LVVRVIQDSIHYPFAFCLVAVRRNQGFVTAPRLGDDPLGIVEDRARLVEHRQPEVLHQPLVLRRLTQ
jgi:hypothetical protein